MKTGFLCLAMLLIAALGYSCFKFAKKPKVIELPEGFVQPIYPSLHSIDEVTISKETIYFNGIK